MRITKLAVDKLPIPKALPGQTAQKRYYDETLKGFGIRVTSGGTKAFFIEKLVKHKLRRITIGRYPELTVEQARKEAQKLLGKIATGIDPIAERREAKTKSITLNEAFQDYLKARKNLKSLTVLDYKRVLKQVVSDWLDKPLMDISKEMIAKRHLKHGEKSKARANLAMRLLRAIFNFAAGQYEDARGRSLISENPVKRLSHTRAWYRIERRRGIIKSHELASWYEGLVKYSNHLGEDKTEMMKDYFLLVLFTGLRRQEAAKLKWSDVDLQAKTMTILDKKNHERHTIPLSDFLYELLLKRRALITSDYVFPAESREGHLTDPRKAMLKIASLSGVPFTVHNLRRTFITVAESLDIPVYALKRLLNHKMTADVTAGYVVIDVERLRKPMQQITDHLLKHMKIVDTDNVVQVSFSNENLERVS